ncbi:Uncharacterized protein FKW44_000914 [Caligus rogercresseyi]|uniref:EF-hand domain-containing protein n=1 Tax=Caligus rogercresseyi TaxID=217165 RepID=A0A7T8QV69_CALRO|nr:Uncharacterized protein FKW44_000914 [Caligus rogercresseyi]
MYDEDGSGTIEMSEMTDIIGTLYEMEGISRECAVSRAKKILWNWMSMETERYLKRNS